MADRETEWVEVGDLHNGKLVRYFPHEDHMLYNAWALKKALKYCVLNHIDRLVQLGDVFEDWNPSRELELRFLRTLRNTPEEVHIDFIPGNHDFSDTEENSLMISSFFNGKGGKGSPLPNISFYTEPTLSDIDGVPVAYLPYPFHDPNTSRPHVCFGHFELPGAKRDNGMVIPEDDGFKIDKRHKWHLGHLHRHQPHYVGTMMQMDFGEPLPKGFVHVTASVSGKKITVNRKYISVAPPYELRNVKIENSRDWAKLSRDKRILHKIFVAHGVEMPENVLTEVNYWKMLGYRSDKELKKIEVNEILDEEEAFIIDPTKNLGPHLKKRSKLNARQIEKGVKHVENIVNRRLKGKAV